MFERADAYERFMGRWSRLLARSFVAFAGVREGEAVLDVGSGTGALASAVCDVLTGGRVVGIDASAEYVQHAAAKATDPRVCFDVGDARQLAFPDASFDRTLSALVLNFVPRPLQAVREMIRVTRPGGVVAAAIWDYGDGMQMLRAFWDEACVLDEAARRRDEAEMPFCRKGELLEVWQREGLTDVRDAALTATLTFTSWSDYWGPFVLGQGPAGAYVATLSADARGALEKRLRARLMRGPDDCPFELSARAWAVRGTVAHR